MKIENFSGKLISPNLKRSRTQPSETAALAGSQHASLTAPLRWTSPWTATVSVTSMVCSSRA